MSTFGDILSGLSLGANQSVRRNAGDTAFEAFTVTFNALSPITTLGDIIYGSGANTAARLAGNTTTTKKFLAQTGTGTNSAAPTWDALVAGDIPNLDAAKITSGVFGHARLGSGGGGSTKFLREDSTFQTISLSPAGSNTQVQYNNSGAFGASSNFTFASNAIDVGQGRMGEWAGGSTFAIFGHKTALGSSSNNYAILQSSNGSLTRINVATGGAIEFAEANSTFLTLHNGYFSFNGTANSAVAFWLFPAASNKFGQIISGLASQSAPLFEVRDNSGNTKFQIDSTYKVGIGLGTPSAWLHIIGTTEQFRAGYDASNYLNMTVGATGTATIDGLGSAKGIKFASGYRWGFDGATPSVSQTGWSAINHTTFRGIDAVSDGLPELMDAFCTLVNDLLAKGVIKA